MDLSESELTRKLADNPNDTRNFNCDDLEAYIAAHHDVTPIYYLIEKYRHVVVIRFSDEEMLKFRMDVTPKSSLLVPIANHSNDIVVLLKKCNQI